jgi:gliding motility-associated-like protein
MRFKLHLTLVFLLAVYGLHATHNRAGEITYRWINGLTYEVTITTYTKQSAPADRCQLTLNWGDGNESVLNRVNGSTIGVCAPNASMGVIIGNDVKLNIYRGQHTYQSPGFYTLSMQDLNRNAGVNNIPNSVGVPFYITSTILINPALGPNSSPQLLAAPIDDGCVNRLFIHNPSAFDVDGDSLAFDLVNCRGLNGIEILETYANNLVQAPVSIDPFTGDFVWDTPQLVGQFNFAIRIREYRKGANGIWQEIGSVVRDMQINIAACMNNPPEIPPLGPFCVEAGEQLGFNVPASDPDGDSVTLTATGAPFEVTNPAQFLQPNTGRPSVSSPFVWNTACNHVREQPYFVSFYAIDRPSMSGQPRLSATQTVEIKVVGPSPKNPQAIPQFQFIEVSWDPSVCTQVVSYDVYRREGFYGFIPEECELGVPEYTEYEYLGSTTGHTNTTYLDSMELKLGVSYCYMIVARFPDGVESYASVEVCSQLPRYLPVITNVDVRETDVATGEIAVTWLRPDEMDSAVFPPPYNYELFRSAGIDGGTFTSLGFFGFDDTTFLDAGLNTAELGYRYRVDLFANGTNLKVGAGTPASSVFLTIQPGNTTNRLFFNFNTPWQNTQYVIYREDIPGIFAPIDTTSSTMYLDTGLVNEEEYCYVVEAFGAYSGQGLPEPLINFSQQACSTPLDTSIPCAPVLFANVVCEEDVLELFWEYPDDEGCVQDILGYNIYYKPTEDAVFPQTPFVSNTTSLQFSDFNNSIVGCYAVTAVENTPEMRESEKSNVICVESCPVIRLPNVFTPNNDFQNDFFLPILIKDIGEIHVEIYNRWGSKVYETKSVSDFTSKGWDGRDRTTGNMVSDGVYFYTITYKVESIRAAKEERMNGTVHVLK